MRRADRPWRCNRSPRGRLWPWPPASPRCWHGSWGPGARLIHPAPYAAVKQYFTDCRTVARCGIWRARNRRRGPCCPGRRSDPSGAGPPGCGQNIMSGAGATGRPVWASGCGGRVLAACSTARPSRLQCRTNRAHGNPLSEAVDLSSRYDVTVRPSGSQGSGLE